jgi:hypothetical protein
MAKTNKKIKPEDIEIFWIRIGGFFNGHIEINTGYRDGEFFIERMEKFSSYIGTIPEFSEKKFLNFREFLVNDLKIFDWKKNYYNNNILDGEQWEIEITLISKRKIKIYGSNEYPENFDELRKKLDYYFSKYF